MLELPWLPEGVSIEVNEDDRSVDVFNGSDRTVDLHNGAGQLQVVLTPGERFTLIMGDRLNCYVTAHRYQRQ
jgi:hypothetical protein